MALRWFVVPKDGSGTRLDPYRPRYLYGVAATWSACDTQEPIMLVYADVTAVQLTAVAANADVQVFPANLDATIGAGALTVIQNFLEARNIPANWVTTADTYRELLRGCAWLCQLLVYFGAELRQARLFAARNLATTWAELPVGVQQALRDAAAHFALDTTGVTGTTTLRAILQGAMQQRMNTPFEMGGVLH